jgi:biphenyl-2,3-diol 1,2-dioxygenase
MTGVTELGYLGLGVRDVAAFERFATDILGLQPHGADGDGGLLFRMDEHHHRFVVCASDADDVAFVGWEVASERALGELGERLAAAGTAVERGDAADAKKRRVAGLIRFVDPSGVACEAFFGPRILTDKPFHSPRPISGFKTGDLGMGHLVLLADDFEKTQRFYCDVLGFRVSDFIHFPAAPGVTVDIAFLHCNPRHHSLAFIAMPSPPKRMHHFMLQLRSLDDVGITYSLCQERGVPIVSTLGRHTNDQMVSFYAATPAGFAVEYGWGARDVDDATWRVQAYDAGSIWGHNPPSA